MTKTFFFLAIGAKRANMSTIQLPMQYLRQCNELKEGWCQRNIILMQQSAKILIPIDYNPLKKKSIH